MQETQGVATPQNFIFLLDSALFLYFVSIGAPLPFSLSSLRKDRVDGRLGGIPYRRLGGLCVYNPVEVLAFFSGKPIVQPPRHPAARSLGKRGRPTMVERVAAERLGLTVREMRLRDGGVA